jgi:hypothetical protein
MQTGMKSSLVIVSGSSGTGWIIVKKPAAGIWLCADQALHELTQPPPAVWFGRWLVVSVGCCVVRSLVVWVAGLSANIAT